MSETTSTEDSIPRRIGIVGGDRQYLWIETVTVPFSPSQNRLELQRAIVEV